MSYFLKQFDKVIYVVKKELKFIPIYGWYTWRLGNIFIDRKERVKYIKNLSEKVKSSLNKNYKVIIFPEGTRSLPQNGLKNFSSSCGVLSVKNNVPVIPICHNSGLFWRNKKFNKESGIVKVKIGPAIYGNNPKNITNEVKGWIQSNFDEIH